MSEQIINPELKIEQTERKELKDRLFSLEGFNELSQKQQRLIMTSLYLSQRRARFGDITFESMPEKIYQYEDTYKASFNWYCLASVSAVERETVLDPGSRKKLPENFFVGEYSQGDSINSIRKHITDQGFPCIVNVSDKHEVNSNNDLRHSFIALDRDKSGNILVWEKKGYGLPFRVIELDEVYKEYPSSFYWGTRELNGEKSKNE